MIDFIEDIRYFVDQYDKTQRPEYLKRIKNLVEAHEIYLKYQSRELVKSLPLPLDFSDEELTEVTNQ